MNRQPTSKVIGLYTSATPEPRAYAHRMAIRGWLRVVGKWIERSRQRRDLAKLDDRFLRDVGISRAEAAREIAKPFWR